MKREEAEIEWILDDDINLEMRRVDGVPTGDVRVSAADGRDCWLTLSADAGELLFDGRFVDVGDDFPRFLGIIDAASEGVTFIGDTSKRPMPDEYGLNASWDSEAEEGWDRPPEEEGAS